MRIAFAGTGYISKVHAQAARNLGLTLTAVVNHQLPSMASFAATFGITRQYTRMEDLIRDGDVDAIIIATPNYLHATQSIDALNAGIHVMVEKPMAMHAAEAIQMHHAAQRNHATLMVAHCWRFDEDVLWLKTRMPELGAVVRTTGYGIHTHWGPSGWFTQKRYAGGGALADMGIHAIDTVRFLLGDPLPVSVYAKIGTHYGSYDVDDTGLLMITWSNGTHSVIESGWWQPHMDGPEAATKIYGSHGFGQIFPTRTVIPNSDRTDTITTAAGFPFPRTAHCPQELYDAQLAYFVDCVRRRIEPNPGSSEGIINMQIVDAAFASAQSNAVVTISPFDTTR
jgi:predicted dehydrogenase